MVEPPTRTEFPASKRTRTRTWTTEAVRVGKRKAAEMEVIEKRRRCALKDLFLNQSRLIVSVLILGSVASRVP